MGHHLGRTEQGAAASHNLSYGPHYRAMNCRRMERLGQAGDGTWLLPPFVNIVGIAVFLQLA